MHSQVRRPMISEEWEQMGVEANRDAPGAGEAAVTIEEWGDFQ